LESRLLSYPQSRADWDAEIYVLRRKKFRSTAGVGMWIGGSSSLQAAEYSKMSGRLEPFSNAARAKIWVPHPLCFFCTKGGNAEFNLASKKPKPKAASLHRPMSYTVAYAQMRLPYRTARRVFG
jgi:hypothetical protein